MSAPEPPSWYPDRTHWIARPIVGLLLALKHAVWRVDSVTDIDDPEETGRYRVDLVHVGGAHPSWMQADGRARFKATARALWRYYRSERWPMCSCCGEPMPCRAELVDKAVETGSRRLQVLESRQPGCCWACGEPISTRQHSVTYRGENLDLPGGAPVRFHTRSRCWGAATAYELRWIAADPRNERILTWPKCPGTLIVHADGASECLGGLQDCRGHETHDHAAYCSCTEHGSMVEVAKALGLPSAATAATAYACPRGCDKDRHPGCAPGSRRRRDQPPLPADDRSAA